MVVGRAVLQVGPKSPIGVQFILKQVTVTLLSSFKIPEARQVINVDESECVNSETNNSTVDTFRHREKLKPSHVIIV